MRNLVLITVDTLRGDYPGFAGGPAHTPVMDELADSGWSFDSCYSAAMLTNPALASVMTSLYPRDHGVYDNESGVADGARTIATALQRHGMRTLAVIGFPHVNPEVINLGQGFDRVAPATSDERRAGETSQEALRLLDTLTAEESFFLWVHYVDPHAPYEPGDEHPPRPVVGPTTPLAVAERAGPRFQRNNPWFRKAFHSYGSVEAMRQRYIAEIEATDAGIGELLAGLAARRRSAGTAVVLTADHGENMGEHNLYFHHGGLYQTTVHIPLVIHVPGATPVRVGGLVASVDIAPTLLELVDAPRWEPMRGRSLVPVVQGRREPRDSGLQRAHAAPAGGSARLRRHPHPAPPLQPPVPVLSFGGGPPRGLRHGPRRGRAARSRH